MIMGDLFCKSYISITFELFATSIFIIEMRKGNNSHSNKVKHNKEL